MLDIIKIDGQPALSINGAIIGTEKDIIQHLRKSEGYDILIEELGNEEETIFEKGGELQWT